MRKAADGPHHISVRVQVAPSSQRHSVMGPSNKQFNLTIARSEPITLQISLNEPKPGRAPVSIVKPIRDVHPRRYRDSTVLALFVLGCALGVVVTLVSGTDGKPHRWALCVGVVWALVVGGLTAAYWAEDAHSRLGRILNKFPTSALYGFPVIGFGVGAAVMTLFSGWK